MIQAKSNVWEIEFTDNFHRICDYLKKEEIKIENIKFCYNEIKEVFKKFIKATKNYSEELAIIIKDLQPNNNTVEGQLIQAIQITLLFNIEELNNLIEKIKDIVKNFKASQESYSSALLDFSKLYQNNYSNVIKIYCDYINDNELFEKYLIDKELGILNENNEEIKKEVDDFVIIEENIIKNENEKELNKTKNDKKMEAKLKKIEEKQKKIEEKQKKKEEKLKKKEEKLKKKEEKLKKKEEKKKQKEERLIEKYEKSEIEILKEDLEIIAKEKEKLKETKKDKDILYGIFKTKKKYENLINETNLIINKLVQFGWNEEQIIKTDFYNYSKYFLDYLSNYIVATKKNYESQSSVIQELNEKIKSEKLPNIYLDSQEYSLHCLSIYMNNKIYLTKENNSDSKQKDKFDNEIYKQLTIDNIGNIIKEWQKSGLVVKKDDLEKYENQKNLTFIQDNIKKIINNTVNTEISQNDKNRIIELFKKDKEYILFFLQKLNNDRSRGGEIININNYHRIGELFKFINDLTLEKDDYDCYKFISILSMTYFRIEGEKKIYIYEYIKDNPNLKKIEFWEKYLQIVIDYDMNNKVYLKKEKIPEKELDKEIEYKKNNAIFSNTLTVINNMTDFGLQKKLVEDFVKNVKEQYSFSPEQSNQIDFVFNLYLEKTNINKNIKEDEKKIEPNNNKEENKEDIKDEDIKEEEIN